MSCEINSRSENRSGDNGKPVDFNTTHPRV